MRFCPFCAQENSDAASECAHCGRRLPQLAPSPTSKPAPRLPPVAPARRAPRAFPRTRPVAPMPDLPEAVPRAVPRARTGTLVGVPKSTPLGAPQSTRASDPEIATRVEESPFAETTQSPRLAPEELAEATTEHTSTEQTATDAPVIERPSDRFDVVDDAADTEIRHSPLRPVIDNEPTGFETTLPVEDTRIESSMPLPPIATQPSARQPIGARGQPMPLPPAPVGSSPKQLQFDPPSRHGAEAAFASLPLPETGPLPIPARTETGRVGPTHAEPTDVLPMPAVPPAQLWPSVKYLLPLAQAIWARHKAQGALRGLLHDDQRRVDHALRDLGEVAWRLQPRPSELRPDLDRADEDDAKRREADAEIARLETALITEEQRFSEEEKHRSIELAHHESEVARVSAELAEQRRQQKAEEKTLRELETRVRAAERTAAQHIARAQKAEATPPAKGGGPEAAAKSYALAEAAKGESETLAPQVAAQEARMRSFDAPIAEREAKLEEEHALVTTQKAELENARRTTAEVKAGLEEGREQQNRTRQAAERSVRLRLIATGTLLSLHRMDDAANADTFKPVYKRLDDQQQIAHSREARINELEAERHGWDRAAVQRGLIVVGAAIGTFAILLIVLIVLVGRR